MKALKSHPQLLLREHIAQVGLALEGIWQWHSGKLISDEVRGLSRRLEVLHDLGKGAERFQAYIENPALFKGDPREKAHTPLSLLLTLRLAARDDWEPLDTLLVAACISAHHGALRSLPTGRLTEAFSSSKTLDDFAGGHSARVLKDQLSTLDTSSLARETGIDFIGLGLSRKSIREASDFLCYEIIPFFRKLDVEQKIAFRLKAQLMFSFLLEADKVFLAVSDPDACLRRPRRQWQPGWVDEKIGVADRSSVNLLRMKARTEVKSRINTAADEAVSSLTAPTGIGKTLLAASWALEKRAAIDERTGVPPKAILVLPYLSIIDQTARVYRDLLEKGGQKADGTWFLTCHSLSERKYAGWVEEDEEPFFIDTWRTELIITTYDQFLLSLLDPRARYQMRFHNLCDALIIMDEVQSLPCRLWRLLNAVLRSLTEVGNSRILLMSATLPPFISDAFPLLGDFREYFGAFHRYALQFRIGEKMTLPQLCRELQERLGGWLGTGVRVLITLNTRACARKVYDHLDECWPEKYRDVPLLLLSADVTPRDRLGRIDSIRKDKPCIVVSTQCIEAGVDIDMGLIIRDFAPWDSIVQVAGRCNREGVRGKWLPVEIVDLVTEKGRRYSEMIYDEVALQSTRRLIGPSPSIREEEVLSYSDRYFEELDQLKDTGQLHAERFAGWQEDLSVKELLRGPDREQHTFLVMDQDLELREAMMAAEEIEDRWERREAWRKLSGRIAQISVSLYARAGFRPEEIAAQFLRHWVLRDGFYDPNRGVTLEDSRYASDGTTFVF
jgi:CRISPR-associated endonuclease/helicase Cas3